MNDAGDHRDAIRQIAHQATRARRQDVLTLWVQQFGWVVRSGPFEGMKLSDRRSWSDGDILPKLIGCYEAELHECVRQVAAAAPDLVVNVGAAEGYYAIGLARLIPNCTVHAFDTAQASQDICRLAAGLNGVGDRVFVGGRCTPDLLQTVLAGAAAPFLFCDCEGYERHLIDPEQVPALRSTSILVECHDFVEAGITQTLVDRLSPTHTLTMIHEGARDPNASPFLRTFGSLDRWLAVCEYRPTMMHWLVARPNASGVMVG
jgi:hypothetical protein